MPLILVIALPWIACPLVLWASRHARASLGYPFTAVALACTALLWQVGEGVSWSGSQVISYEWIPSLGVKASFIVDGLSLFFGFLVTVMGVLIGFYSQHYMDREYPLGRYYCYLLIFMSSMLWTLFSNDLLCLFVGWEVTGIASFLLIGYYHFDNKEASKGAQMALLVTTLTGLALLVGIVILGQLTGTYQWSEIAAIGVPQQDFSFLCNLAFILMLVAAFGKSCQFPFHFWLPNAMMAPSPVTAYLHTATLVNLGVFLVARMYPIFQGMPLWLPLMTTVCFATMLLGAILSLLSHNLKRILAFATVSQLGFFIGFYGLGDAVGVRYDFVHVLDHAFYKASLFLLVGIIAHATGISDIRHLGGLSRKMPQVALLCFVSVAAMAGIPGSTGFLSKELVLGQLLALSRGETVGWIVLLVVSFASIFKVAFSIRLFYHIFVRKLRKDVEVKPYNKHVLWAPAILSACALIFGVWTTGLERLVDTFFVSGLQATEVPAVTLWHGATLELGVSLAILAIGVLVFMSFEKIGWKRAEIPRFLRFGAFCQRAIEGSIVQSKKLTDRFHTGRLDDYLLMVGAVLVTLVGGTLALTASFTFDITAAETSRGIVALLIVVALVGVVYLKHWISQLLSLSVAGFMLIFYFVLYQATDLALTQLVVEIVTLVLLLILGSKLAKRQKHDDIGTGARNGLKWGVASGVGLSLGALMLWAAASPATQKVGDTILAEAYALTKSRNIVNAILVDIRGFDTLGEVMVLIVAGMGVLGLLVSTRRKAALFKE